MKRYLIISFVCLVTFLPGRAGMHLNKVEPPNWWTGMKNDTVQLMIYGSGLSGSTVSSSANGITVLRIEPVANPSYAFVTILIDSGLAGGTYPLQFKNGDDTVTLHYPVYTRENPDGRYRGFGPDDVVYLITPDRFADGDTTNESFAGMKDGYNPGKLIGRHGGDIRGIIDHLDYFRDLGVTALWMNPMVENDTRMSYHGYAATDLYRIDRRFGTNDLYRTLVAEAHRRGLKIILDHVSNHISIDHPWLKNLPDTSWLNGSARHHENNRHQKATLTDPHADSAARANVTDGWFQDYMPDLNQRNLLLTRYLIQNTIWWIESTGLDGIREDTYSYSDPEFLSRWAAAILREYPHFNIVGEVWLNDPVYIAPYQKGSCLSQHETNLPSVTDYGLFTPFMRVFGRDNADISVIYECLGKDFLYPAPDHLMTFLDNHDVTRIMSICSGDVRKVKLALTLLLTLRGIPEMLYGTEIGMEGEGDHGRIRADFPGGFPHDRRNAFTAAGRTADETALYDWTKKLLSVRKEHASFRRGELVHFPPADNCYVYFRILPAETTMVITNNSSGSKTIRTDEYKGYLSGTAHLVNLLTNESIPMPGEIRVGGKTSMIFNILQ